MTDTGSTIPLDELRSAPERIAIDNRQYVLGTCVWRDFMSGRHSGGSPLMVSVGIRGAAPFLEADRLWVISGRQVWETELTEETKSYKEPGMLEKVVRGDPHVGDGHPRGCGCQGACPIEPHVFAASQECIKQED